MAMTKGRTNITKKTLSYAFGYVAASLRGEADREVSLYSVRKWADQCESLNDPEINKEEVIFDIYDYFYNTLSKTPNKTFYNKKLHGNNALNDYRYMRY